MVSAEEEMPEYRLRGGNRRIGWEGGERPFAEQ